MRLFFVLHLYQMPLLVVTRVRISLRCLVTAAEVDCLRDERVRAVLTHYYTNVMGAQKCRSRIALTRPASHANTGVLCPNYLIMSRYEFRNCRSAGNYGSVWMQ